MKKIALFLILVVVICWVLFFYRDSLKNCAEALIVEKNYSVYLDIADNYLKRTIGLMFVNKLESNKGMLFVFDDEKDRIFWMKNTFVPLDIIFVSSDFKINNIYRGVRASYPEEDEKEIPRVWGNAKYVVEISSGMSKYLGLEEGKRIDIKCIKKKG